MNNLLLLLIKELWFSNLNKSYRNKELVRRGLLSKIRSTIWNKSIISSELNPSS